MLLSLSSSMMDKFRIRPKIRSAYVYFKCISYMLCILYVAYMELLMEAGDSLLPQDLEPRPIVGLAH